MVNENIGLVIDNIRLYNENQRLNKRLEVAELLERGFLSRQIYLDKCVEEVVKNISKVQESSACEGKVNCNQIESLKK